MKRPSFQFYPADWRNNAKLRRCSESARGAWIDVLCVLHDSDEYGVLRWPLEDIARSAGISMKSALELVSKGVLKGSDSKVKAFTFTPIHARQEGETVTLIKQCSGPCWYSSRMVVDEWKRHRRGRESRFEHSPNNSPKDTIGDKLGDGPTSSSSSTSTVRLSDKASDKASKSLSWEQKEIADRMEKCLNGQWTNDAGKWIARIRKDTGRCQRIVAEVESAIKEGRVKTTAAQYAEQINKEFK